MDFSSKSAILKLILPHVPHLTYTALLHTFYLSTTSRKWDLRTELTIKLIRAMLANPSPHGSLYQQQASLKDPGIRGKIWISKVEFPAPELNILDAFCQAIDDLKSSATDRYTLPAVLPVQAEWTGYREAVDDQRPRPDISEAEHYECLMKDTSRPLTILYFHGGAHVMMDPSSHRRLVSQLCKLTGGRALSVRYRLAPQNPFPAALLDAYIAYLSLLHPPPGSFHQPVPASEIVFAGDSAGGNLCLALVQLLLHLNRADHGGSRLGFHGHSISFPVAMPAGVACHSPWLDLAYAFPSQFDNAKYDYLPELSTSRDRIVPDSIWPAKPPRGDLYCDTSMLCHPFVSPAAAQDWKGAPPLWFGCGEELLADESKQVAQTAAKQGVVVQWEQWEAMCHCFGMVLVGSVMSKQFFHDWAQFCRALGKITGEEEEEAKTAGVRTRGTFFEVKTQRARDIDVQQLGAFESADALKRMKEQMARREASWRTGEKPTTIPNGTHEHVNGMAAEVAAVQGAVGVSTVLAAPPK